VLGTRDGARRQRVEQDAEEIRRLEELWAAAPALAEDAAPGLLRRVAARLSSRLGTLLALGWVAFMVTAYVQPTVNPEAVTPLWADLIAAGFFFSLVAAAITGLLHSPRAGFTAAAAAGAFGVALAIGCKATEHHLGAWWLYELGATALLTGAAVFGIVRRAGR
jgi:hypothetical protein